MCKMCNHPSHKALTDEERKAVCAAEAAKAKKVQPFQVAQAREATR